MPSPTCCRPYGCFRRRLWRDRRSCRARARDRSRRAPSRSGADADRQSAAPARRRSCSTIPRHVSSTRAPFGRPCSAPISRANRAAPSPTSNSCGSRSITARAMLMGCAKPSSAPTAPLRRVVPSMTAASSCNVAERYSASRRGRRCGHPDRPRPAGCRPRSHRAPLLPSLSSSAAVSMPARAFPVGEQDHGRSASRFGCAILVRNRSMRGSCAVPKNSSIR